MSALSGSPVPIAILTFGHSVQNGHRFLTERAHKFHVVDVRKRMVKNPDTSVNHGENGMFEKTQCVVMQQDGFVDVMTEVIDFAFDSLHAHEHGDYVPPIALGCTQGVHRVDVTGRMSESLLNSLKTPGGDRVFNVMAFHTSSVKAFEVMAMIDSAERWHDSPWTIAPGVDFNPSEIFAYRNIVKNKVAFDNFTTIVDEVSKLLKEKFPVEESIVGSAVEIDHRCAAESEDESKKKKLKGEQIPAWASHGTDTAAQWYSFLISKKCDTTSIQELFCLSQMNEDGYVAANSIIAKVLKKQSDGVEFGNLSAFVHKCTTNARDALSSSKSVWGPSRTDAASSSKDSWEGWVSRESWSSSSAPWAPSGWASDADSWSGWKSR